MKFLELSFTIGNYSFSVLDIFIFFGVLLVFQVIIWVINLMINRSFRNKPEEIGKKYTLKRLVKYFLYVIGLVVALDAVGIELSIILAGSAALLIGLGYGVGHIFNDIISGFVILFEGVIKVGDFVELDGHFTRVEKIEIRSTKVMTRDGNILIIPNSSFTTDKVLNWSHGNISSRVRIKVGVAYGSDTKKVREILVREVGNHPEVLSDHRTEAFFLDFGDSALVFEVRFWLVKSWERDIIMSQIRFAIDQAFREEGIRIPFPQRDVHFFTGDAAFNPQEIKGG